MRVEIINLADADRALDVAVITAAIAANMRRGDIDEAAASGACGPHAAILRSIRVSHDVYAGLVDDNPACLFGLGIGDQLAGVARPWLLGTPLIDRHRIAFLRNNRDVVEMWSRHWRVLENWVDARNVVAQRWLAWLGFTLDEAAPFGPFKYPFHRFEMRA